VLQVATAQAPLGFAITGLGAVLVLLARDLDLPVERLAWLSATFGLGLLVIAPLGPLLLRGGPRRALRAGALATGAGCALLAVAANLPVAVAGALLLGVGGAAIVLATPAMLTGPHAALDISRVIAVSSTASVLAPAGLGAVDALGVNGRLALLVAVPPLAVLAVVARPAAGPQDHRPEVPRQRPRLSQVARRWLRVLLSVSVEFCFTIWGVARLRDTGLPTAAAALLGTAFPVGMAVGRLAGPALLGRVPMVPLGGLTAAAGAVVVSAVDRPGLVTAALVVAGAGVATLYPVTLADLVATPHLAASHAASLGALASGAAIVGAPVALAAVAGTVGLRAAFLITLPLIALLLGLSRPAGRRE
jgi:MFS family permease